MTFNRFHFLCRAIFCSAIALAGCSVLVGCAVGPDYTRPAVSAPVQWSENSDNEAWKIAAAADAQLKGEWWKLFCDTQLNALQEQAQLGNLNLRAAVARLDQARALAQVIHSALLPSVNLDAQHIRTRNSANRPANTINDNDSNSTLRDDNIIAATANYEVDLFGRARRANEAGIADAQQSAADLENIKLLLAADVATNYFDLRGLGAELVVLDQTLAAQSNILDIVRARYTDGEASGIDMAQQELIVANNHAQQQLLLRQYAQQRHALATLLGINVDALQLNAAPLQGEDLPAIPLVLPSDLLQRRPDIASAERAVAAANAQIGVARAAWFPTLNIAASSGFESAPFNQLFDAPSAIWSVGVAASQTVFDGGRIHARENYALAKHREAEANYRATVLSAWREVEDNLSNARTLAAAHHDAQKARTAAIKIAEITDDRYAAGLASAIERYIARQSALLAQREEVQLAAQQWINAVALIKALGGGWNEESIVAMDEVR